MSLRDIIAADVYAVLLNTNDFAETVTYIPVGGGSRSVVCLLEQRQEFFRGEVIDEDVEYLEVTVGRNEAHETKGGVNAPQTGDRLIREGEGAQQAYAFDGEVLQGDLECWHLLFARPKPRNLGNAQIERR